MGVCSSDLNEFMSDKVSSTRCDPVRISDNGSRSRRFARFRSQNAMDVDLETPESSRTYSYYHLSYAGRETPVKQARNRSRRMNRYHPFNSVQTNHQSTSALLIPRKPFDQLVREIAQDPELRFQNKALKGLKATTEQFLIHLFEDTNLCALHGNRSTIMPKDLELALHIREEADYIPHRC